LMKLWSLVQRPPGKSGRGLVSYKNHLFIAPVHAEDWYRKKITSSLHRYTKITSSLHRYTPRTGIVQKSPLHCTGTQKSPLHCTGTRRGLVSSKMYLFITPEHVSTNFVRVAYTDTRFYQLCLHQSETALSSQSRSYTGTGIRVLFTPKTNWTTCLGFISSDHNT
jgi:hypothetical protein